VHPYSHLRMNNDPDNFQFAIVTDRTGGNRAGVFEDAIKKLNLLQPEFVMSIGDLIEGYTRDEDRIYSEWDEFNGFIKDLEMPFFYLPGNHDYINDVMAKIWKEKFGPSYYHFVYRDVLFLCLNSEEATKGSSMGGIEKPQYDYAKKVLDENPDVKWTLVFMHQPLWLYDNSRHWSDVEDLLKGRQHTVFAGHNHHYVKYIRNDSKYITLATTGGLSKLRGPDFGEFDHVAWITMTEEGPVIANLLLNGIWDEDVLTEEYRSMIEAERIMINPVFVDNGFSEANFEIRITNDDNFPMSTLLRFGRHDQLSPEIVEYHKLVPPNSVETLSIPTRLIKKSRKDDVEPISLYAWFIYQLEDGREITLDAQYALAPVKKIFMDRNNDNVDIEGSLDEWPGLPLKGDIHSETSGSVKDYKGDYDASYEFNVLYDDEYLYLAISIWDDEIVLDRKLSPGDQDGVVVNLDARPLALSSNRRGTGSNTDFLNISYSPSFSRKYDPVISQPDLLPEGTIISTSKTVQGFDTEIAIPMQYIRSQGGDNWESLRLNIAYMDKDGKNSRSELWWRPAWYSKKNYIGSGTIFKKD
jgi:hypothetical protein